jgi:branched-chain amino acid aminotransferase
MKECFGKYFILNGDLKPAGSFDDRMIYEGESIYEVIRLIDGYPVFFNEHSARLANSTKLLKRVMLADSNVLRADLKKLVESEKAKNINIKIVFNYNISSNYTQYLIHSEYPSEQQYLNGVKGTFCAAERKDPESKVISRRLRAEIQDSLLMEGAYEALLVNNDGFITEGSRSNFFFIKNSELFTAPDKSVLNGITRKQVLDICRETGISVKNTLIHKIEITDYNTVFMTGTSPGILPLCCVDDKIFNPEHKIITILQKYYLKRVEESIRQFKLY